MRNYPLILLMLSVFYTACRSEDYGLVAKFDIRSNTSTLVLTKGSIVIDSLPGIDSFYGADSIVELQNGIWDYYYHPRCGTECSLVYYMRVLLIKDKIKNSAQFQYQMKGDYSFWGGDVSIITAKPHLSQNDGYIKVIDFKNGKSRTKSIAKLKFDKEQNVYYNSEHLMGGNYYKTILVDSTHYVNFGNNIWKSYNDVNGRYFDL